MTNHSIHLKYETLDIYKHFKAFTLQFFQIFIQLYSEYHNVTFLHCTLWQCILDLNHLWDAKTVLMSVVVLLTITSLCPLVFGPSTNGLSMRDIQKAFGEVLQNRLVVKIEGHG